MPYKTPNKTPSVMKFRDISKETPVVGKVLVVLHEDCVVAMLIEQVSFVEDGVDSHYVVSGKVIKSDHKDLVKGEFSHVRISTNKPTIGTILNERVYATFNKPADMREAEEKELYLVDCIEKYVKQTPGFSARFPLLREYLKELHILEGSDKTLTRRITEVCRKYPYRLSQSGGRIRLTGISAPVPSTTVRQRKLETVEVIADDVDLTKFIRGWLLIFESGAFGKKNVFNNPLVPEE